MALTLRVVGGLSSEEIARAFLVPVPTVQARITRAKKTIAAAGVPFELPAAGERRERLGGVLSVLYVIFTEGSTATSGDRLLRPDVAYEAIRLTRTLAALQPDEPEVHGLLALCELTAARFPARTGPDGSPVLLEDQDRRRWDFSAIRRGLAALAMASTRGLGPYGLQAAIAAVHASALSVEATFHRSELDDDGIVVDIGAATAALDAVLGALRYQNLDEVPELAGLVTSTEVLARWVADRLHEHDVTTGLDGLEVVLRESPDAWVSYTRDG